MPVNTTVPDADASVLKVLSKRLGMLEEELLAHVKTSLQPRFTMVDLKAKQYGIIIKAELAARRDRLLAGILCRVPHLYTSHVFYIRVMSPMYEVALIYHIYIC